MKQLYYDLRIALPSVLLWTPCPKRLQSLAFVAGHGRRDDLRKALLRSIRRDAKPLIEHRYEQPKRSTSFQLLLGLNSDTSDLARAQREMLAHLNRLLIVPLLEQAETSTVTDRLKLVQLACMASILYLRTLPLLTDLAQRSAPDRSWSLLPEVGLDLEPFLKFSREFQRLLAEITP